ncbi:hypothetical protein HOLleu_20668 [Holothuria leucospilota]|uniref:Uncharacterized protein n=1 Tax=Holothuria leucospilota TaxID=206669 RepID=A0A9Q1C1Y7_HOLLE|nr:hypothetical protein HOLleu_20668 [Holothuria leucospilota]
MVMGRDFIVLWWRLQVIWGHQRSKSKISQEFPRSFSGSSEFKKQNFSKIPKIIIWRHKRLKSKNSKDRHRVTRSRKANIFTNSQDRHRGHKRSKSIISQEFPRSSSGLPADKKQKFSRVPKIKYEPKKLFFQHVKIAFDQ